MTVQACKKICGEPSIDDVEWAPCRRIDGHDGPCAHLPVFVEPLRVVAAAACVTINGPLIHDQVRDLIFSVPRPGRHHNIAYLMHRIDLHLDGPFGSGLVDYEQGFLLSDGSFATREHALEVAKAAGQIIARCGGDEHALYSENLW